MTAPTARPCPFCAIAGDDAIAHLVYEDGATVAFLDRAPVFPGHVLLIPRTHVETFWDADEATAAAMALAARRVSVAVKTAMSCDGIFLALNNVVSQSITHLHTHVIPRNRGDGLFSPRVIWKRTRYKPGQADQIATAIRKAIRDAA